MSSSVLSGPLLHKRGTQQAIASYAGPKGELVVDTTNNTLVVQTGANGGEKLAKASAQIIAGTGIAITGGTLASNNTVSLASIQGLSAGSYGPAQNVSPAYSGTFTVPYVTVDSYGRVTAVANRTITLPAAVSQVTQATRATQDGSGNTITSTYATKSELSSAIKDLGIPEITSVIFISASGNDSNDGKTETTPIKTVAELNKRLRTLSTFSDKVSFGTTSEPHYISCVLVRVLNNLSEGLNLSDISIPIMLSCNGNGTITISSESRIKNCTIYWASPYDSFTYDGSNYITTNGYLTFRDLIFDNVNVYVSKPIPVSGTLEIINGSIIIYTRAMTAAIGGSSTAILIESSQVIGISHNNDGYNSAAEQTLRANTIDIFNNCFILGMYINTYYLTVKGNSVLDDIKLYVKYTLYVSDKSIITSISSFAFTRLLMKENSVITTKNVTTQGGRIVIRNGSRLRIEDTLSISGNSSDQNTTDENFSSHNALINLLHDSYAFINKISISNETVQDTYFLSVSHSSYASIDSFYYSEIVSNHFTYNIYGGYNCFIHGISPFDEAQYDTDTTVPPGGPTENYSFYTSPRLFVIPKSDYSNDSRTLITIRGWDQTGTRWTSNVAILYYIHARNDNKNAACIGMYAPDALCLCAGETAKEISYYSTRLYNSERVDIISDGTIVFHTDVNNVSTPVTELYSYRSLHLERHLANFGSENYNYTNVRISGNLGVRAEGAAAGTLGTDGNATLGGTLTVNKTSSLKGKVTITTGGLACTGAATFSSTVTSTGNIRPAASDAATCGVNAARWTTVYAKNTTISTSDIRRKTNITDVPDELLDIWDEVKIRIFKWVDSATPRLHAGIIAQDIQAIFEAHGLDIADYSFFCYDSWDDEYEDVEVIDVPGYVDSDGFDVAQVSHIEQRKVQEKGDLYSIRYEEFLVIEAAYQRRRADRLEARIAALEAKLK